MSSVALPSPSRAGLRARESDRALSSCTHCGLPVPSFRCDPEEGQQFCCEGCSAVHALLAHGGLLDYYAQRDRATPEAKAVPVSDKSYAEFDDPAFQNLYCRTGSDGLRRVELFLEGVHCSACVWLVERMPRLLPGVLEARLDITRQVAYVIWDDQQVLLSRIAKTLASLGYAPHACSGQRHASESTRHRRALLGKLAIAGAAAGNAMLMAFALYGGMFAGMDREYETLFRWGSLVIAVPAVFWSGSVFHRGAWAALRARTPHMDLPVSLGILAGFGWGAFNTARGHGDVYFDTITVLIFLLLIGRWIQSKQQQTARDAAELLHTLAPSTARLVEGDLIRDVPAASLPIDALIEVRAGEHVSADGVVERGSSSLDSSLLTGETRPEQVGLGSMVHAGCINLSSPLRVRVRNSGAATRVGQLMKRVEEATLRRAPIVKLADRFSAYFVVAVLILAVLTAAIWSFIDSGRAIDAAVALLVVTCPCALGMATPLAVSVALGRAAQRGILVKGGDALEQLATPGLFVFDKTGTLTRGELTLIDWQGDTTLKPLVRAAEVHSAHPIAAAFQRALPSAPDTAATDVEQTLGGGIKALVDGQRLIIGCESYMRARAEVAPWVEHAIAEQTRRALTPVLIATNGVVRALAGFGDPLRDDAAQSLRQLRDMGYSVAILSGDHPGVVAAVAAELAVPLEFARGGVTPEGKLELVECMRAKTRIFMVGDGINDAAALSAANVGIAVHGGAEASLAAADVFLRQTGIAPVVELVRGARRTLGVIRRGLAFSLFYNWVGVCLAVLGLLNPLLAAILMPLSSLTVITSSFRSRTFRRAAR